jgi:hypothetical protein
MLKRAVTAAIVTSTVCLLGTAFGRGSFVGGINALGLAFLMLAPLLVGLGLLAFGRARDTKALGAWVSVIAVAIAVGSLLTLPAGSAVNRADIPP